MKSINGKGVFGWLSVTFKKRFKEEEKGEENGGTFQEHISCKLPGRFLSNLDYRVACIEGIKYVNWLEIGQVVVEIREIENGNLAVPVNITLVRHMAFLAADVRPCVLMVGIIFVL